MSIPIVGVGGLSGTRPPTGIERPGARSGVSWSRLSISATGAPIFALLFGKKCHILLQTRAFLQPLVHLGARWRANCGSVDLVCSENVEKCPLTNHGTPFRGAFDKKFDLVTFGQLFADFSPKGVPFRPDSGDFPLDFH